MSLPIITYDYDFSPYGRKIRLLLTLAGLPFQRVDQPSVLPRPDLESLGITYRRIPILAIGKDIYCDTAAIVDIVQRKLRGLQPSPSDKAFEAFGTQLFWSVLSLVPAEFITPAFKKDRETIYPVLARPDFETLRPSCLGEFGSMLDTIETQFLAHGGPYIGGVDRPSLADVHVGPLVRWTLQTLGVDREPGFDQEHFPRVHAWLARLPDMQPDAISAAEAADRILQSAYLERDVGVSAEDPLGIPAGAQVSVESTDSAPGAHPQVGTLVGLGRRWTVVELGNGVRLHFPRAGYVVRRA